MCCLSYTQNTHTQYKTHPQSSGRPFAVWYFAQYWGWNRAWFIHSYKSCQFWESNPQHSGYKSDSLTATATAILSWWLCRAWCQQVECRLSWCSQIRAALWEHCRWLRQTGSWSIKRKKNTANKSAWYMYTRAGFSTTFLEDPQHCTFCMSP